MATIGADFPQSGQKRRAKLEEIPKDQNRFQVLRFPECSYMIGGLLVNYKRG